MTQATVTPKYVNPPKPGKTLGSIKDQGDVLWLCEPGLLGSFSPGKPVTVEYETMKFRDGTERPKITGVVHGTTNGAAPTHETPRGNGHSPNAGREIFITGIVGRAMGSGKFPIEDLNKLTFAAAAAWDSVMQEKRPAPPAQADPGLNDSIPF